jgi:ADP-ribosyl-[dinitrogen reductase] hydrolase
LTGDDTRAERLLGGLWGHLIGDALGVPYEFGPPVPPESVRWGHRAEYRPQPEGTWSDDGGLMLALLDSLIEAGFDTEDQGRRALDWWLNGNYSPGPLFDIGLITRESLDTFRLGVPAEQAGATGEMENGNGSLMRILPVALVHHNLSDRELFEEAMRASALTHRHPRSKVACGLYVLLAKRLIHGEADPKSALADAFSAARSLTSGEVGNELELIATFSARTGSGYVVDCFWSAWDSFAASSTYEETVKRAVAYGDDTDTTACVAGGLAGIRWGLAGIPQEWRAGMRGRDIVDRLAAKLLQAQS